MKEQWGLTIKPALLLNMAKLPQKELLQVSEKINLLTQDPRPDAKVKKHLTHLPGRPYRIRSGKYRIFYTFNQQLVSIYKIDERDEDTYNDSTMPEPLPGADVLVGLDAIAIAPGNAQLDWERIFSQPAQVQRKPLPEPITVELLKRIHISERYHARLLCIPDGDSILEWSGVSDDALITLYDYMYDPSFIEVMHQKDLMVNEVKDLLRYHEGELLTFLLKLSPEQQRFATWSLSAQGPTLVKGGPGTGKSTVALYRIKSLLDQLLMQGYSTPHILFTTYTKALITSSRQLLEQLLGENARYVRVETADSIAGSILYQSGQHKGFTILDKQQDLCQLLKRTIAGTPFEGNSLQRQAQQQAVEKISIDYLLQELQSVIVARHITTLEEYLKTPRNGRKLRLNAMQRRAIWLVYTRWCIVLAQDGYETWQQRRVRAEVVSAQSSLAQFFDAVVIDEAQDLDPSAMRMLITLSKAPNRIFITADANQSIYGSNFSWSDVHSSLKFSGRTSILHANYRSTYEIGEAAQSYLASGILEDEVSQRQYTNNGPLPDARSVANSDHEGQLITSYFKKACRNLRLTISSCAVLCPTEKAGRTLANAISTQGIEATYMSSHDFDLKRSGVKVITLKAAKGLEFPIIAVAGFTISSNYPNITATANSEEITEALQKERRTMFVGMTRAMRALLVILPHAHQNQLLQGFDAEYWNFSRPI